MDAVDPEVNVAFGREITLAPTRMLVRPGLLEPPDGRGREPAGILAEQCDQRLLEIAGGNALQVEAATSASTACPNSVLAPLRKTSVSGSENVPGWVSSKTLVSVTAYHSFGEEVEALNTPTIRRLTPSCRHQLSALAHHRAQASSRW